MNSLPILFGREVKYLHPFNSNGFNISENMYSVQNIALCGKKRYDNKSMPACADKKVSANNSNIILDLK